MGMGGLTCTVPWLASDLPIPDVHFWLPSGSRVEVLEWVELSFSLCCCTAEQVKPAFAPFLHH